jgi:hypothetical protein
VWSICWYEQQSTIDPGSLLKRWEKEKELTEAMAKEKASP